MRWLAEDPNYRAAIKGEAIKSKKIMGVLQIGNVDLMLDGIEGGLGVRLNRVSPELVSLSAGQKR